MNENVFDLSPMMKRAIITKLSNGEPLKQIEDYLTAVALKKIYDYKRIAKETSSTPKY